MPQCAPDFFVRHFTKMPAIVEVCQRIMNCQLIDFFVITGFHAVVADEFQDAFTHRDLVAVGQCLFIGKP